MPVAAPADRRVAYTQWPPEVQAYYWTLSPSDQEAWWALTDDQRVRLYAMNPDQRRQAWVSIRSQLAGNPATRTTAAATTTGNVRWVSNAVVQNISADAPPANPPICGPNMYDNCINAWEAGKRGPNVTKPLSYWPGRKNDPRAGE